MALLGNSNPSLEVLAVQAAILCLTPVVAEMTDPAGVPYSPAVELAALNKGTLIEGPQIVLSLVGGTTPAWGGLNRIADDYVAGTTTYMALCEDAEMRIQIRARSEAERAWLMDWIYSRFHNYTLPDANGEPVNNALQVSLGAYGIIVGTISREKPASERGEPRPAMQPWEGTISVACEIDMVYTLSNTIQTTGVIIQATPTIGGYYPLPSDAPIIITKPQ